MDEIILGYRKLIELIFEEERQANLSLQDDLLKMYKNILNKECEKIEKQINQIINY